MRALLVDIGNTSLKIGITSAEKILTVYTLPTDVAQSADILGLHLVELIRHAGEGPVREGLVCSVVPDMDSLLFRACTRFLGITPLFAHSDLRVPLENRYERPQEVGSDRLVAAFAARRMLPEPRSVISVDFGTATTFDCVTGTTYLGGLICPGVKSSLDALAARTAKLPRIALNTEARNPQLCKDTVTSLNHGFLFGFAAMAEGLCRRLKNRLQEPVGVIATGGFASAVAGVSECFDLVRGDLVLEGLRVLWLLNKADDTNTDDA